MIVPKNHVGCSMSETRPDSITLLQKLVRQIMKEEDPRKFDELGAKIWQVLDEREGVSATPLSPAFESRIG
jgi:hypothetical protein